MAHTEHDHRVPETTGWQKLLAWMAADDKHTQSQLARLLGISQPSVRAWVSRSSRPSGPLRTAVCLITGAAESEWETEEEAKQRAKFVGEFGEPSKDVA